MYIYIYIYYRYMVPADGRQPPPICYPLPPVFILHCALGLYSMSKESTCTYAVKAQEGEI